MALFNRILGSNIPLDWETTHQTPDKNTDWYSWHIAIHPFTDMIVLYIRGELGSGSAALDKMQALFDLSATERQQLLEIYQNSINPGGTAGQAAQISALMEVQSILRAVEREIPQQYHTTDAALQTWLYGILGITTTTEDR